MDAELYLDNGHRPDWLFRQISRKAAEQELHRRVGRDGQFLVREKIIASHRIVFALSFKYENMFRHHLLERRKEGPWSLDGNALPYSGTLNSVIRAFQSERDPGLACVLAADPPPPPPRSPAVRPHAMPLPATPGAVPTIKTLGRVDLWSVDVVVQWLNAHKLHRYAGTLVCVLVVVLRCLLCGMVLEHSGSVRKSGYTVYYMLIRLWSM